MKNIRIISFLLAIIDYIYSSLQIQKTCFKNKDYKEAQAMSQEIIDWLEELKAIEK